MTYYALVLASLDKTSTLMFFSYVIVSFDLGDNQLLIFHNLTSYPISDARVRPAMNASYSTQLLMERNLKCKDTFTTGSLSLSRMSLIPFPIIFINLFVKTVHFVYDLYMDGDIYAMKYAKT